MTEAFEPIRELARVLAEYGPLPEDEIARRLRDGGVADPEAVLEEVLDETEFPARQLADDRWVWLPALLAGRVFTHRLSADEVAHDALDVAPDLGPITALCDHDPFRQLADGSSVEVALPEFDDELLEERDMPAEVVDPMGALLLAPGTLAALGAAEGDLVGLRLTEQGLVVERVTAGADSEAGPRLATTLDADEPVYVDAAVWTVCAQDPALFTEPVAPLGEIADDYGLARVGGWLAPSGFDFARWHFGRECAALAELHELDPDDAIALYTLIRVYEQIVEAADTVAQGAEAPELGGIIALAHEYGHALAEPLLAELLVAETVGIEPDGAAALGLFAEVMEPRVPRAARVACRWLRAVALERMGDINAAERELQAAESMDPDWPLPLLDLARFASDRGDAERGLALLRRAGVEPDYPLLELLERYRAEQRHDIGRNEPCWCGSGRKYKKCHLGREQPPLDERAAWLYAKAVQHALLSRWNDLLFDVGYERGRHADDDGEALDAAMSDPLVTDAVLFEGGAFEDFLEARGTLLPDDERLLAAQWLLVERSVFEVEQVRPGEGVTVRDVRTGVTHEVRERAASRELKPGQLVCARVLPAGDTMQFFGGVDPVALHERDQLIELLGTAPDPVTLVAQLSRRLAPPALTNTEGDALALCETTAQVGDPGAIESALDGTYDRVDRDEPRWFEHVTTHGMPRIRATLLLDGDTLRVETNSEERMERVLATLRGLDPALKVLDDIRHPVRDAREAAELAERLQVPGEDALDPDDPEIAAALDEFIRDYETRWLDEPVPVLGGHTPRQAADDPTRRGDLIKLLNSLPAGSAMDGDRLRAALGLQ